MTDETRAYDFSEGFQRKILALAIRSDLLVRAPGAFQSRFFASGKTRPPRRRLAELVETFAKENKNERPGTETMEELIRRAGLVLKPGERDALEDEWREVASIEVPDVGFVISQVKHWAKDAALGESIMHAADLVEASRRSGRQEKLDEIRGMIDEALQVGEPEEESSITFIKGDHHRLWHMDHSRRRVRTGFNRLDRQLGGGIQLGEVFYVLAPPKGAKSAYLMNMAMNASRHRHGVAFFSYEMRKEAVVMRLDRILTQHTKWELRNKPLVVESMVRGMRASGAGEIFIQEFGSRRQGVDEAARVIERRRGMGHEIDLVCFDYLNIMGTARGRQLERRHEIAHISREIAAMAKELDVAIWSAALVNRKSVEKERLRKQDIAEAFEVVAVADGMVAVCAPKELVKERKRRLYLAALREEEDEKDAGLFSVDLDRMTFRELPDEPDADEDYKSKGGDDGKTDEKSDTDKGS